MTIGLGARKTDDSSTQQNDVDSQSQEQDPARGALIDDGDSEELLNAVNVQTRLVKRAYSGPLPTADEFSKYGDVEPTAPNRILAMTEKEQDVRHRSMNRTEIFSAIAHFFGHTIGLMISLTCIAAAVYLAILDKLLIPALLLGTPMLVHIQSFIAKRDQESKRSRPDKPVD